MIIHRILMEDKTGKKNGKAWAAFMAVLAFLAAGTGMKVNADVENTPPPGALEENSGAQTVVSPPEVSEARRHYDSITWHDGVSSGPNHLGYAMLLFMKNRHAPAAFLAIL